MPRTSRRRTLFGAWHAQTGTHSQIVLLPMCSELLQLDLQGQGGGSQCSRCARARQEGRQSDHAAATHLRVARQLAHGREHGIDDFLETRVLVRVLVLSRCWCSTTGPQCGAAAQKRGTLACQHGTVGGRARDMPRARMDAHRHATAAGQSRAPGPWTGVHAHTVTPTSDALRRARYRRAPPRQKPPPAAAIGTYLHKRLPGRPAPPLRSADKNAGASNARDRTEHNLFLLITQARTTQERRG
jgi:hypothetical protein